jgi:uncharacterized repeat protein (TIGR03803 family)
MQFAALTSRNGRFTMFRVEPKFGSVSVAVVRRAFTLAVLSALFLGARFAQAQTITDIYDPQQNGDGPGTGSLAALVRDSAGNLYGTTFNGGINAGSVFEVSPDGNGGWTGKIIYTFTGGADGGEPGYGPLLLDSAGNLFGTTTFGGANGLGTVFELSPSGGGWTETVLYSFTGGQYNYDPINGLVMDSAGNLYGTTLNTIGGTIYGGAVFELSRSGGGWTEQIIYAYPQGNYSGLAIDYAGNLYGIGSTGNRPTVFELSQGPLGNWIPKVLYTFGITKPGYGPQGTLVLDKALNLYGTIRGHGTSFGSVYKLTPPNRRNSKREWSKKTLYLFKGGTDGADPFAGVTLDNFGNVYGTTLSGGNHNYGTVYELFNFGNGSYGEAVLASVGDAGGVNPFGGVIRDPAGNIYGTTAFVGRGNLGNVYQVTPF